MPLAMTKATLHVVRFPMSAATGNATTVAPKIPPLTRAIALPRASGRTSEMAAPAPKTQKPPMHSPRTARATIMTPKSGAVAATTFDTSTRTLKVRKRTRRSIRDEPRVSSGAVTAAVTAGTTTMSPANPIETPKPRLTSGRRPTGRTSEKTSAKDPSAIDQTASHRSLSWDAPG
jgi:hypothetical protein